MVIAIAPGHIGNPASLYSRIMWSKFPLGAHSSRKEKDTTHNPRNFMMFGWSTDDNLFTSSRISAYIMAKSCKVCSLSLPLIIEFVKHFRATYWWGFYRTIDKPYSTKKPKHCPAIAKTDNHTDMHTHTHIDTHTQTDTHTHTHTHTH